MMGRTTLTLAVAVVAAAAAYGQAPVVRAELPAPRPEASPPPRLALGQRTGDALAKRDGLAHTAGAAIDVTQPRPDTVVILMTGTASVGGLPCETSAAAVTCDVCQHFRVVADKWDGRPVRLVVEAHVVGLLRGSREGAGVASTDAAEAVVTTLDGPAVIAATFPCRSLSGKDTLFVNDRLDPAVALVGPGEFTLTQRFGVRATHPKKFCHRNVVTAAFGPDGPKPPEWLSVLDPTRDVPKGKPLGFQVTLRVEPAGP